MNTRLLEAALRGEPGADEELLRDCDRKGATGPLVSALRTLIDERKYEALSTRDKLLWCAERQDVVRAAVVALREGMEVSYTYSHSRGQGGTVINFGSAYLMWAVEAVLNGGRERCGDLMLKLVIDGVTIYERPNE